MVPECNEELFPILKQRGSELLVVLPGIFCLSKQFCTQRTPANLAIQTEAGRGRHGRRQVPLYPYRRRCPCKQRHPHQFLQTHDIVRSQALQHILPTHANLTLAPPRVRCDTVESMTFK